MASTGPRKPSAFLVLILLLLLPPVGLILLWIRRGTALSLKVLGSLVALGFTLTHLVVFFGLRVEMDGTGRWPIFSFHRTEAHYEALERHRREQALLESGETVLRPGVGEAPPPDGEAVDRDLAPAAPDAAPEGDDRSEEVAPAPTGSTYWSDYRGPRRDGGYTERRILTSWPEEGPPRLWSHPVGGGYASFVAAEGRIFTIEQRRDHEVVAAYELETGRELWAHSWEAAFREAMGGDGPRATPTWSDGRLLALGAEGDLVVLEAATGREIWSVNILEDNGASNLSWGMSASPLVVGEKVIVHPGGSPGRSVVAYHLETGERIWSNLDDQAGYASPVLARLGGRDQVLVFTARRILAVAPEDGSLLWDYPWVTSYGVNSAQPLVVDENHVFISSGYGKGAALLEIVRRNDAYSARPLWENINMKNKFNSSVLHEGHVYGLDEGILACVDLNTGERRWKAGRYGYGQLILADGHLIVLTERGDLVLVEATPEEHRELARISALRGKSWNSPALVDGRLLVRNTVEMACYDLRTQ